MYSAQPVYSQECNNVINFSLHEAYVLSRYSSAHHLVVPLLRLYLCIGEAPALDLAPVCQSPSESSYLTGNGAGVASANSQATAAVWVQYQALLTPMMRTLWADKAIGTYASEPTRAIIEPHYPDPLSAVSGFDDAAPAQARL